MNQNTIAITLVEMIINYNYKNLTPIFQKKISRLSYREERVRLVESINSPIDKNRG